MLNQPITLDVPIEAHEDGSLRIAGTRILLEVLIAAYKRGDSAEEIQAGFPSLKLSDIYAVIAYYLANPDAVETYLSEVEAEAQANRQKIEALPSYQALSRSDLDARSKKVD